MDSFYSMGDKRSEDGTILRNESLSILSNLAVECTKEIKKMYIYSILAKNLDYKKLDFYFELYFYRSLSRVSHQLAMYKWHNNNGSNLKSVIEVDKFPWIDLLKIVYPDSSIKWKLESFFSYYNRQCLLSVKKLVKICIKYFHSWINDDFKSIDFGKKSVIAIRYYEGIDFDKRSDLFWYKNSDVDSTTVLIYFEDSFSLNRYDKSENILKKIEDMGFNWLTIFPTNANNSNHFWRPKGHINSPIIENMKLSIMNHKPIDKMEKWLKKETLGLLNQINYWHEFFIENNIKIHREMVEQSPNSIIKNIALDIIGGCSFGVERGHMVQHPGFFGSYPNHIFFLWGIKSARQFMDSNNIRNNVLISGHPYPASSDNMIKSAKKIRDELIANGAKFIILLLDSNHSMNQSLQQCIYTPIMYKYYKYHLQWVLEDEEIGLIIKSKKPVVQENLTDINQLLDEANKSGRCYNIADPFGIQPSYFGGVADFVVATGIYLPGALIECILKGTRGVFFDYPNQRNSEKELYEWGDQKVIFDNLETLIDSLKLYKQNPNNNPELGDWSDHLDDIESFQDGLGGDRVGEYVRTLQQAFDNGLGQQASIKQANSDYISKWGDDKIVSM